VRGRRWGHVQDVDQISRGKEGGDKVGERRMDSGLPSGGNSNGDGLVGE